MVSDAHPKNTIYLADNPFSQFFFLVAVTTAPQQQSTDGTEAAAVVVPTGAIH